MINIALNTFREIVRNKILYLIIFFAFIFIVFSMALGKLTIGDDNKIIVDFGLSMIEIFGFISVLFVGSQLLFKEIEGKTIFLILSKPIKRYEFIVGKFLGFSFCIALILFLQSILYIGVLYFKEIEITNLILVSLFFTFLKLEILLVFVFFFSTFMSNILTIIVSIMLYFISHSFSLILDLVLKTKSVIAIKSAQVLQLLFPPFEALNTKDNIGTFSNFNFEYYISNSLYSLFYIFIVIVFTILIFNKKSFER